MIPMNLGCLAISFLFASSVLAAQSAKFKPIDLSAQVQKRWADFEPGTTWAAVPQDAQTLKGVPFQLDGTIEVTGMGAARDGQPKPAQASGIAVTSKASQIYLLHGTGYDAPDGTPIAALILHFSGGETRALPIRYGVHVRNWWAEPHERSGSLSDPNSEIGWTGSSPDVEPRGVKLRLFKTKLTNPLPDREIQTIDFVSLFSRATPVLVGLSLEQGEPGDIKEAEKLAAQGKELLESSRSHLTVQLRDNESKEKIRYAAVKAKALGERRPIDLGSFYGNDNGEVRLYFPQSCTSLEISASAPGFVFSKAEISERDGGTLPSQFDLALKRGTAIAGKVQTPGGEPIAGAKILISGITRDTVGQFVSEEIAEVLTDKNGKWQSASVPPDFASLSFSISHRDYRPGEFEQADATGPDTVSKEDLLKGKAEMILKPMFAVTGTVTDSEGKKLKDASITLRLDERRRRNTTSDEHGAFRIPVPDEQDVDLVVQAPGHAPFRKQVSITENLSPTEVKLARGKTLKGRILDAQDNSPVPDVTVSVVSWNNLTLLNWRAETDKNGEFKWDSAPTEPVTLSFTKSGYQPQTQTMDPSTSEEEIRLAKVFRLSGKIIDAETKKPIASFKIVPGNIWGGDEDAIQWNMDQIFPGSDGKYVVEQRDQNGGSLRYMFQADGYQPVASPAFFPQGWQTFDAELKKAKAPVGIVKNNKGEAVENAEVAVLGQGYLMLSRGKFRSYDRNFAPVRSDSDGKFELASALGNSTVVAVHPDVGYAETTMDELLKTPEIVLKPWAKVEGQLKIGSKNAGADHAVMLAPFSTEPGNLAYDYDAYRKQTDDNGKFTIDFVPPGERRIIRLIPLYKGSSGWSHYTPFTIQSGETKQVQVGGVGRPIIGKLVSSEPDREIDWKHGHHSLGNRWPTPPRNVTAQQIQEWQKSPEVMEARRNQRAYTLVMAEDGSFRIDDVPGGNYTLRVHLTEPGENNFNEKFLGSLTKDVTVDEIPSGQTDEPVDLGTLTIQIKTERKLGTVAPPIQAKTLDDQPFSLSNYKGKFVLLDFWATWCGPCVAEIPNLKTAFEKHGKNPDFVMIGLSLDPEMQAPRDFVKKKDVKWVQAFLGEWSKTTIPDAYGVSGIPATFLINPEGQIIAKDLRGPELIQALDRSLSQPRVQRP